MCVVPWRGHGAARCASMPALLAAPRAARAPCRAALRGAEDVHGKAAPLRPLPTPLFLLCKLWVSPRPSQPDEVQCCAVLWCAVLCVTLSVLVVAVLCVNRVEQ